MPHHGAGKGHSAWEAFKDPKVYVLSFSYFCFICGVYVISFWLPTFIKEMGVQSPLHVGLLPAIPYGITAVGMILIGRHSDLKLERRWHCAIPAFLGAVGRRLGRMCDLDGPLLMLASGASGFMTGTEIVADGGHLVSSL